MTKDEAQRRRWTFYEAVNLAFKSVTGTDGKAGVRSTGKGMP